jgi:hypothetical protein
MPENKTKPTTQSVAQFLAAIPDDQRRQDCETLVALMSQAAGAEPKLWGSNIIGFGQYHYAYASGREGDMMLTGFSPRKPALVLYGLGSGDVYIAYQVTGSGPVDVVLAPGTVSHLDLDWESPPHQPLVYQPGAGSPASRRSRNEQNSDILSVELAGY